jgi:hypothetical protein
VAIIALFEVEGSTAAKYDEVIRRLEAAGQGRPAGRLYHCAFEEPGGLHVFDVCDSQADFDRFGETLMPILGELGIDPASR